MSAALQRLRDWRAEFAIVLGSGLSGVVPNECETIPYGDFADLPKPSVSGHAGQFALGKIDNVRVIFAQGRVHLYEGLSARDVTAGVRLLSQVTRKLILTNAAGILNREFKPGDWMMISDHINLTGTSPLLGASQFVDQTEVYSSALRETFAGAARKIDIVLREGVYANVLGPQYETPAEARMLRSLGADAVGMSTVLEAIQARALGMEVAGFSCLTNYAATSATHDEVLDIGRKAATTFSRLLSEALK